MHDAYLLLGGNNGDKLKVLDYAVTLLKKMVWTVVKQSSFYKIEPWENINQQFF
jgi:7,8-dihydro-6-hydroxymethylpterin-pyrophosphokinase